MKSELFQQYGLENPLTSPDKRIATAYHHFFSRYHHELYDALMDGLAPINNGAGAPPGKHYPVAFRKRQTDGSDFYAALEVNGFIRPDTVIAPVWIAHPIADSIFHTIEMANAFKKSRRLGSEEQTITDNFVLLSPYIELRQDDNSPKYLRDYWGQEARESVTAEVIADTLAANGVDGIVTLDIHSRKALDKFNDLDVLCLTALPLFGKWLNDNSFFNRKSNIVALDIGALQRTIQARDQYQQYSNEPIGIVVLDKKRSGHSVVGELELIFGDPSECNNIIVDESIASGSSVDAASKLLKNHGSEQQVACISHGVLCGNYSKHIQAAVNHGLVALVITNSLPQTRDVNYMAVAFDILPIDELLIYFGREVANRSVAEVHNDPKYVDFIHTPQPKSQVVESLIRRYQSSINQSSYDKLTSIMQREFQSEVLTPQAYTLISL